MSKGIADSEYPGRGDLRISLTTRCNLRCLHCHAEGNVKPWEQCAETMPTISEIGLLIGKVAELGAQMVRFTGGEPAMYPEIIPLLSQIQVWASQYPTITRWGINTNGVAFAMNKRLRDALLDSAMNNIVVGLDSVRANEKSKPSSPVGMAGLKLFNDLKPLIAEWISKPGRTWKFNVVYTGEQGNDRVLEVIAAGRSVGADVAIIEMGGSSDPNLRRDFEAFRTLVAYKYQLEARKVPLLDQIHLFDGRGHDPIRFYQDHCKDTVLEADGRRSGCKACRAIHLRVGPMGSGLGAVPCPFECAGKMIQLTAGGEIILGSVEAAIHYNGRGPDWAVGTKYE